MRTSETGLALIRSFEGKRLTGYIDAVGIPTIGWGHTEMAGGVISYANGEKTAKVLVGQSISEAEAKRIHERDTMSFEAGVVRLLKRSPRQAEYDAMIALAFNIGVGAFGKSSVLRKFNASDANGAADAFLMWNKAGGKVLAGLTRRRNAERALFLGDIAHASKYTGVALPGYGSRLEPAIVEKPEETGAKPDDPGTPVTKSTTIWSQIAAVLTTLGTAAAQALGAIDWKTAAVITAGGVAAFAIWTISERMRHAREGGV
jgi:lysozyme